MKYKLKEKNIEGLRGVSIVRNSVQSIMMKQKLNLIDSDIKNDDQ